jgi:hypothetical protein
VRTNIVCIVRGSTGRAARGAGGIKRCGGATATSCHGRRSAASAAGQLLLQRGELSAQRVVLVIDGRRVPYQVRQWLQLKRRWDQSARRNRKLARRKVRRKHLREVNAHSRRGGAWQFAGARQRKPDQIDKKEERGKRRALARAGPNTRLWTPLPQRRPWQPAWRAAAPQPCHRQAPEATETPQAQVWRAP